MNRTDTMPVDELAELTQLRARVAAMAPHWLDEDALLHPSASCTETTGELIAVTDLAQLPALVDLTRARYSYCGRCPHPLSSSYWHIRLCQDAPRSFEHCVRSATIKVVYVLRSGFAMCQILTEAERDQWAAADMYEVGVARALAELVAARDQRIEDPHAVRATLLALNSELQLEPGEFDLHRGLLAQLALAPRVTPTHVTLGTVLVLATADLAERARQVPGLVVDSHTMPAPPTPAQRDLIAQMFTPSTSLPQLAATCVAALA